ncbi:MAG: NAAT family transporter [Planctomycetaceae bacterium]|nr:NAAT family transporter [Planctomycetaceae bacterium]
MTLLSATILLFLLMDPMGNLPIFVAILGDMPPQRRWGVLIRELLISLLVLMAFLFAGKPILELLHIQGPALSISGGIVLFLVALRMVFALEGDLLGRVESEPFIVPLAIPLIAGPATLTMLLILATQHPNRLGDWVLALLAAWAASAVILAACEPIQRVLGRRGLTVVKRLAGMMLVVIATQMFLDGLRAFLAWK